MAPTAADFRSKLAVMFLAAAAEGRTHLEITAGDLHRAVGGYPAGDGGHRMPACCAVMRAEVGPGDTTLREPPRGAGASLAIRYALPRTMSVRAAPVVLARPIMGTAPQRAARSVVLVACVKKKQSFRCTAGDLYVSPLFCKMRRFAENNGDAWFILSAEYGLLAPESLVDPYERTLRQMSPADRSAWAARVNGQIDQHVPNDAAVAILAGAHYRALIEPFLRKRGNSVHVPMEGMRIGEQLRWLGESA